MRERYPLVLKPVFKDYLWGGTKLKTEFGMTSDLENIAESWVLSCQKDGESVIQKVDLKYCVNLHCQVK